jgi:predicted Zn-ribbon and HTH transcriptional regulator
MKAASAIRGVTMRIIPVNDPLITIERFRDLPLALLAKGKLESAGIQCWLADENMVRMDWLWSNLIGGMRLQVSAEDAQAARSVLLEPTPETFTEDEVGHIFQQPRCPRCNSLDIGFESIDRFWTYGLWLLLPFVMPIRKDNWRCYACRTEWIEDPDSNEA